MSGYPIAAPKDGPKKDGMWGGPYRKGYSQELEQALLLIRLAVVKRDTRILEALKCDDRPLVRMVLEEAWKELRGKTSQKTAHTAIARALRAWHKNQRHLVDGAK
jgi:hypothetical protein